MDSDDLTRGLGLPSPSAAAPVPPVTLRLPAEVGSVTTARELVTALLAEAPLSQVAAAELAVSEIVTNAVVHGRGPIELTVARTDRGCRVEVYDHDPHLPRLRWYADTATTGRGLHLVASVTDRWGAASQGTGKVVWFEVGDPPTVSDRPRRPADVRPREQIAVRLSNCPLLLHLAWQERSQAVLREHLAATVRSEPAVLALHAEASAALNALDEQIPPFGRPDAPAPLIDAVEPRVTATSLELRLTREVVAQLETLRALLVAAASGAGHGIARASAHPELDRFGAWVLDEVERQVGGGAAQPWLPPALPTTADATAPELYRTGRHLWPEDGCVVVMDQAGVLVRVAGPVRTALGYRTEADLVGRPLLMLVPERFRQAHLAGTALHATNGRDVIFRHPVTVPILTADGREVLTRLRVRKDHLPHGAEVFVGDLEFLAS